MAPLFQEIVPAAVAALPAGWWSERAVPEEFSSARRPATGGELVVRARFGAVGDRGEFRSVHIAGPRAEIVNFFFFPAPRVALPVFAMEFVAFGAKPVVGVIDLKAVTPAEAAGARAILRAVHGAHPGLQEGDEMPAWYLECRSGDDFFTRPKSAAEFVELAAAQREVWAGLVAAMAGAGEPAAGADDFSAAVRHYKDHHRANSPGRPFLYRTFGEEWTERFMRDWLFA